MPLAAALSIPLTTNSGAPLTQRDLLLVVAVTVIVISLTVQGLTLEPLVCALRSRSQWPVPEQGREAAARLRLAGAGTARLDELAASGAAPTLRSPDTPALNARIGQAGPASTKTATPCKPTGPGGISTVT